MDKIDKLATAEGMALNKAFKSKRPRTGLSRLDFRSNEKVSKRWHKDNLATANKIFGRIGE